MKTKYKMTLKKLTAVGFAAVLTLSSGSVSANAANTSSKSASNYENQFTVVTISPKASGPSFNLRWNGQSGPENADRTQSYLLSDSGKKSTKFLLMASTDGSGQRTNHPKLTVVPTVKFSDGKSKKVYSLVYDQMISPTFKIGTSSKKKVSFGVSLKGKSGEIVHTWGNITKK